MEMVAHLRSLALLCLLLLPIVVDSKDCQQINLSANKDCNKLTGGLRINENTPPNFSLYKVKEIEGPVVIKGYRHSKLEFLKDVRKINGSNEIPLQILDSPNLKTVPLLYKGLKLETTAPTKIKIDNIGASMEDLVDWFSAITLFLNSTINDDDILITGLTDHNARRFIQKVRPKSFNTSTGNDPSSTVAVTSPPSSTTLTSITPKPASQTSSTTSTNNPTSDASVVTRGLLPGGGETTTGEDSTVTRDEGSATMNEVEANGLDSSASGNNSDEEKDVDSQVTTVIIVVIVVVVIVLFLAIGGFLVYWFVFQKNKKEANGDSSQREKKEEQMKEKTLKSKERTPTKGGKEPKEKTDEKVDKKDQE